MVLVGLGVTARRMRNVSLLAQAGSSLLMWLTNQSLGGLCTGSGTDPNSGPLIAVMALTLYGRPAR